MIIGIGTDIVNINRIEKIINKFGEQFLLRILHPEEYQKLKAIEPKLQARFLARRFAGKEAIAKAIGSGINLGLRFKDIAIINDDLGKPIAKIYNRLLESMGNYKVNISLSDDYPVAMALVVLSR